jgi:hypothetical protein
MVRMIADTNGDGGDFAPTAVLKEKGAMLKGILIHKREVKTQYGLKPVYSFKVIDASCKFTTGKDRAEVQPAEGDTVDAFAPTRLARQLAQVTEGETVTITYVGTKKAGKGMPAHVFDVTVEGN